jgi:hypothetical protein
MDETSSTDLVGMEFLMTVMEVRESVDSTSPEHMQPLWQETKFSIAKLIEDLTIAFDEEQDVNKAIELAAQLQYWHRIESTIREKMDIKWKDGRVHKWNNSGLKASIRSNVFYPEQRPSRAMIHILWVITVAACSHAFDLVLSASDLHRANILVW